VTHVVWWEIETPAPESFQGFYSALWGWTFEPAFAGTGLGSERERTALGGADRWFAIIRDPSGVSFGQWTPNELEPGGRPDSWR
jgi:hypothetical protein